MNVPSGYTALDLVGFTDKGPYNSATAYVKNDIVHYGGNLWRCLVDDTTNVTPTEGTNWTIYLSEPTSAAEDIIAPVEASAVSTHQYAVGKQLILNDTLYRVTAAVNIGDTLAIGTNITASDTVVEQLATKANTSSLATVATSGSYADLSNKPTLGTAAAKDVPASGNASTTEVVMGDDTRLSDARNAADVYSWAKASTKPTYNGSEINTSAAQTGTSQSAVAATIASGTSMDAAVKELLDNDVTLSSQISSVNEALSNLCETVAENGAVNLLPNNAISQVLNGVTFTVNSNKTVTVSGTATATTEITIAEFYLDAKSYKISGTPSGGSSSTYFIYHNEQSVGGIQTDVGSGATFTVQNAAHKQYVKIHIASGTAITTPITFKPMITLADQPNSDYNHYVPYAMTNRELTVGHDYSGLYESIGSILPFHYGSIEVNMYLPMPTYLLSEYDITLVRVTLEYVNKSGTDLDVSKVTIDTTHNTGSGIAVYPCPVVILNTALTAAEVTWESIRANNPTAAVIYQLTKK